MSKELPTTCELYKTIKIAMCSGMLRHASNPTNSPKNQVLPHAAACCIMLQPLMLVSRPQAMFVGRRGVDTYCGQSVCSPGGLLFFGGGGVRTCCTLHQSSVQWPTK